MKKRAYFYIILVFFLIPLASIVTYAQPFDRFLGQVGQTIFRLTQQIYFVYALTFILYFMLFYGAISACLRFVRIFRNDDNALNKAGKTFALAASGITTLSIFWATRNPQQLLRNVLDPFGILGGLLLGAIFFMLIYFGLGKSEEGRNWKLATMIAGLAMVMAGMISSYPNIMWWGWLIFLIGLIPFLISFFKGKEAAAQDTRPEKEKPNPNTPVEPGDKVVNYSEPGTLTVQVQDTMGNPLEGVRVKVFPDTDKKKSCLANEITDKSGKTSAMRVPSGPLEVRAYDNRFLGLPINRNNYISTRHILSPNANDTVKINLIKNRNMELRANPKDNVPLCSYEGWNPATRSYYPVEPNLYSVITVELMQRIRSFFLRGGRMGSWRRAHNISQRVYFYTDKGEFVSLHPDFALTRCGPNEVVPGENETILSFMFPPWFSPNYPGPHIQEHPFYFTTCRMGRTHIGLRSSTPGKATVIARTVGFPPQKIEITFSGSRPPGGRGRIRGRVIEER